MRQQLSFADGSGIGRRTLNLLETGPRYSQAHLQTSGPLHHAVSGMDLLASNPARGDAERGAGCLNLEQSALSNQLAIGIQHSPRRPWQPQPLPPRWAKRMAARERRPQ